MKSRAVSRVVSRTEWSEEQIAQQSAEQQLCTYQQVADWRVDELDGLVEQGPGQLSSRDQKL
jgi:uncharacterized protein HemX